MVFLVSGFPSTSKVHSTFVASALLERRGEGDFGSRRRFFSFGDAVDFVFDAFRAGFLAAGPAGTELDDRGDVLGAFFQRFEVDFVDDDRLRILPIRAGFRFLLLRFRLLLLPPGAGTEERARTRLRRTRRQSARANRARAVPRRTRFALAVFPSEMAPPVHPISSPVSPVIATMPSRASKPLPDRFVLHVGGSEDRPFG